MNGSPAQRADRFRLDLEGDQLLEGDMPVRLERQPMELLILLVERKGQLVTRDEIASRLWADGVFVDTDRNINTIIRKLRQALKDDPDHPEFVETVVGKGYRFVGSVEVSPKGSTSTVAPAKPSSSASLPPTRIRLWAAGIVAALLIVGAGWFASAGRLVDRRSAPRILSPFCPSAISLEIALRSISRMDLRRS